MNEYGLDGDSAILLLAYIVKHVDVRLPKDFMKNPAPAGVFMEEGENEYIFRVEE